MVLPLTPLDSGRGKERFLVSLFFYISMFEN
jgi:hypothetical protein